MRCGGLFPARGASSPWGDASRVGWVPLLQERGWSGPQRAAVGGSVKRATYPWRCARSGVGELVEVDDEAMPAIRL